jgi:putative redox protein
MKIELNRIEEPFLMVARNEAGAEVLMDANTAIGGTGQGFRPMELLATSLAGCSSIDVLSILRKKKKTIRDFSVDIDAKRRDEVPALFEKIHVTFLIDADVSEKEMDQALKLTFEKYCSVSRILEPTCLITYSYTIK